MTNLLRISVVISLLALVLVFGGCTPVSDSQESQQGATSTIDLKACQAGGGSVRNVCKMQFPACVTPFPDAGRVCTDNSQCKGKCIVDSDHFPEPDEPVTGLCQEDDDPCGCKIEVVNGRIGGGTCTD